MQTEPCSNCGRTIGNLEARYLFNEQVVCAECDARLRQPEPTVSARPTQVHAGPATQKPASETVLLTAHPAMFRNHPIAFMLCVLMICVFGLGVILLLLWWLQCYSTTITISSVRTTIREGILAKRTNEVRHKDARNIIVTQSIAHKDLRCRHPCRIQRGTIVY